MPWEQFNKLADVSNGEFLYIIFYPSWHYWHLNLQPMFLETLDTVISGVNIKMAGENDVTWGQANDADVSLDQESRQS
jgi:hypothetical protein